MRPRQPRRTGPVARIAPSPRGSTSLQFDNRPQNNGRPEGGGRRRRSRRNRNRFNDGAAPSQQQDVFTQPEFPQPVGPPLLSAEQLTEMSKAELNELAKTFEIENPTKIKKDDLVKQIVEIQAQRSGLEKANGVLDVLPEGYGFLRRDGYLVGAEDIYISQSQIRRFELRRGDLVAGQVRRPKENEKYYGIVKVETVNGLSPEQIAGRRVFDDLGAEPPSQRFTLDGRGDLATRALDLFAPLGKGQRALAIAPPRSNEAALLLRIAKGIEAHHPDAQVIVLLIDERPEAVTHLQRTLDVEVVATTFEEHADNHVATAELVFERAKRVAELGGDAVVLVSSFSRLVRAYATLAHHKGSFAQLDPAVIQRAKRLFGTARAVEGGGSLTVVATIGAGSSAFDALVLEELAPAANAEIVLSRELVDVRAYPPVDLLRSSNWYEEQLLSEIAAHKVADLRRALAGVSTFEASERIYAALGRTKTNEEFLTSLDLKKV
ncbi:transcription termination factor Rho [Vulcanimicrobium alpinum]|uniref:Transcription termination factor Rho n=1 Tax=Vulcanimicrobium alpinum TaxID=3016050 RepID=A0AAN1XXA3_UNVUL|nr:transcription termination factor Rho [Vulcanimicrobium alpinum]